MFTFEMSHSWIAVAHSRSRCNAQSRRIRLLNLRHTQGFFTLPRSAFVLLKSAKHIIVSHISQSNYALFDEKKTLFLRQAINLLCDLSLKRIIVSLQQYSLYSIHNLDACFVQSIGFLTFDQQYFCFQFYYPSRKYLHFGFWWLFTNFWLIQNTSTFNWKDG